MRQDDETHNIVKYVFHDLIGVVSTTTPYLYTYLIIMVINTSLVNRTTS